MSRNWPLILFFGFLTACGSNVVGGAAKSDYQHFNQAVPFQQGELLIARKSSGGGATGGFVYDLLACPSNATGKCDVLAHVDTNDQPPPRIVFSKQIPTLLLNRGDTVWAYSNFTYKLNADIGTRILLSYQ